MLDNIHRAKSRTNKLSRVSFTTPGLGGSIHGKTASGGGAGAGTGKGSMIKISTTIPSIRQAPHARRSMELTSSPVKRSSLKGFEIHPDHSNAIGSEKSNNNDNNDNNNLSALIQGGNSHISKSHSADSNLDPSSSITSLSSNVLAEMMSTVSFSTTHESLEHKMDGWDRSDVLSLLDTRDWRVDPERSVNTHGMNISRRNSRKMDNTDLLPIVHEEEGKEEEDGNDDEEEHVS